MRFTKIILAGLIALGGLWTSDTYAAEKRCGDLGQNCVCSEPLNTNNYVEIGAWLNPADSTTKQCTAQAFDDPIFEGAAIVVDANVFFGSNDPAILALLPAGHQVQYFHREPEGNTVDRRIFHTQARFATRTAAAAALPGTVTSGFRHERVEIKRFAGRFYIYRSPNYDFAFDNGGKCTNGKWGGIDTLTLSFSAYGNTSNAYNFVWGPWTPYGPDCCEAGPYNSGESPAPPGGVASLKGKWWRYEAVITNRLGGTSPNGFRLQVFIKNVTDNWPEQRIIDTNGTLASPAGWIPSANLTPGETNPEGIFKLVFNAAPYRANAAGVFDPNGCRGWSGLSHFMVAQWDTDAGQRIGAAYEIEGGGSSPSVPTSPSGLRVR